MENLKQQAIKNAYGEHWDIVKSHVDEMGWIDISIANKLPLGHNITLDKEMNKPMTGVFRPKSLRCLEGNYGWISILSAKDLPKDTGRYFAVINGKVKTQIYRREDDNDAWLRHITHYQPILKPNPPIY